MISEPDRGAASTTTVPLLMPAMIRLRRGKSRARGSSPGGRSADDQPDLHHPRLPRLVLGRIEDVDAARRAADRAAVHRPVVSRGVDAPGKAGHDDQSLLAKVVRQSPRKAAGGRRGVAGADDRHGLPLEKREIALGDEQRRRVLHLAQQARVKRLAEHQISAAELLDPGDLALGLVAAGQPRRLAAAAPGEVGHGGERRLRASEARDQLAIGHGPDAGRADQPQAVGEVGDPMRGSVPFVRRKMFSRCFQSTSNAKPSSIGNKAESPMTAAVTGALTAAAIPATDEIRIVSSRRSQTAA